MVILVAVYMLVSSCDSSTVEVIVILPAAVVYQEYTRLLFN